MREAHAHADLPPEHFAAVLDTVSDAVFTVNREQVITSFNRAAEELTGLTRAAVIGRRCCDVFARLGCSDSDACPLRLAERTGCVASARRITLRNGHAEGIPVRVSFRALRDAQGTIVGGVETIRRLGHNGEVPHAESAPAGVVVTEGVAGADGAGVSGDIAGIAGAVTGDDAPLSILDATERQAIVAVLRRHAWNRAAAATELGISRVTLWRKMRKLGIADGASA